MMIREMFRLMIDEQIAYSLVTDDVRVVPIVPFLEVPILGSRQSNNSRKTFPKENLQPTRIPQFVSPHCRQLILSHCVFAVRGEN